MSATVAARRQLPPFGRSLDAGQLLMSKLAAGSGDATLQFIGDSTGNETVEWIYLLAQAIGASYPNLAIDYKLWSDPGQNYPSTTVIQAGVAPSPGIVFQDTFSRVESELYQSTPDIGAPWGRDGANASGDWTVDGTKAVRTADTTGGFILADGGTAGDLKMTIPFTISTVATGSTYTIQFVLKRLDNSNRLLCTITVSSTGTVSWTISKVIGGSSTTVQSGGTLTALSANTSDQSGTLVFSLSGTTLTATIGASTVTGSILQTDADAVAAATTCGVSCSASSALTMSSFTVELIGSPSPQKLTVYNCSVPGMNLSYQQPILATCIPVAPDLTVISTGHNYLDDDEATYHAAIDSFLNDLTILFPSTGVVITSQNPKKAPATHRTAHFSRQISLRSYCEQRKIGYIPLFERWNSQSGGGVSLIQTDGTHPTTGSSGTGSSLWRDVAKAYLDSLPLGPYTSTSNLIGNIPGVSITEVEIDFGSSPMWSKSFTIIDGNVSPSSKLVATQSGSAATGRDADENEMDALILNCKPGSGQFTMNAFAFPGPVSGKYKINYFFA